MCGIFACISQENLDPQLVLSRLKKLEYRGYDSWGVACFQNGLFEVEKEVGKIGDHRLSLSPTTVALGHTRWATHGGVTKANAHPHLSDNGQLAVIHNGIIENHLALWDELSNTKKQSDTDTEVFVHLVASARKKLGLVEAVRQSFKQVQGLSAFVLADVTSSQLVAIKTGSPLVIGVGKGTNYIASDAHALLGLTNNVIFLDDGQMAVVTATEIIGYDVETGQTIELVAEKLNWASNESQLKNFTDYSLQEINEQPSILRKIATDFSTQAVQLCTLLRAHKKVYCVGCGTAYYAALFSSYVLGKVAGLEVVALSGSEVAHKEVFMQPGCLVLFFTQSGETVDITQPVKRLKRVGVTTAALVNVFGSTVDRTVDHSFLLEAGPEVSVMSTKALIAMISFMMNVAYTFVDKPQLASKNLVNVAKTQDTLLTTSYYQYYIQPVVSFLNKAAHCFVIGRGNSYPIALEAALKLKEVTYLHAEGFAGGELKHGVIALIETGVPCLVFAPEDQDFRAIISSATEVKARGGVIIGVAEQNHPIFDFHLPVVETPGFTSLAQVVIAQLLAYHLSILKGIDPDKPRNLAKSVTVG